VKVDGNPVKGDLKTRKEIVHGAFAAQNSCDPIELVVVRNGAEMTFVGKTDTIVLKFEISVLFFVLLCY
jgi:hypothetical protein